MLSKEKIARINALSKKSKAEGLSDVEAAEQKQLREEYIKTFRASMDNTLQTVTIVDPEGNDVTPEKLKQIKKNLKH
ncbi:uncharacterized protein YnzC (UPF0291/DUF896 family) [Bacillus tianshenii]|uniref:UPF0291 protein JOC95_000935 n=1 Tax=Sutcliffiella tianshenii TaxID=1463404 RepID=A0ABS2NWR3_9BACI|nr:DUF896 domain-containing protein [Bacillus tianshenii]MBM7619086.1 uncharacterized protein YnzC (UPF0291/DUF896 family) [Bacillus tianshenii]MCA1320822.1 DUF896 domain-containing protein [Bacillus tianshenii]